MDKILEELVIVEGQEVRFKIRSKEGLAIAIGLVESVYRPFFTQDRFTVRARSGETHTIGYEDITDVLSPPKPKGNWLERFCKKLF